MIFSWLFGGPSKHERKMCRNKVRYQNYPQAQAALNRINPRKKSGKPIRYYKCPHCKGYHLTKTPLK